MTYEEMLARASAMRSRDLFGRVDPEELKKLPAVQTEKNLNCGNGITVHLYELKPEKGLESRCPMFINFHGGGFIKGRQDKDRVYCSGLAEAFGALVWDIDYSLAPEHPFPAAVNEAYAVTEYAFAHAAELQVSPERIFLLGHSAGGNLAAVTCMRLSEERKYQPTALLIEYFPADLLTDPAEKKRVETDMPAEVARTYNAFYCGPENAGSPSASPLLAEDEVLKNFPDTLIITAGLDSLKIEDEEFALRLKKNGVCVEWKCFEKSHHGFTINRTEEWKEAADMQYGFLRNRLS